MGNIPEEVLLALAAKGGGGGGGTSNYEDLSNKPQIGGVTLSGNKSASDLGLADDNTVQGILDGQSIDSFGDVETALSGKQNTFSVGDDLVLSNNTLGVQVSVPSAIDNYTITQNESHFTVITKTHNGVTTSETYASGVYTTYNIDNLFTLKYDGYWEVDLLVASTEYPAGQSWTWQYAENPAISNLDFVVSYATGSASEFIGELQESLAGKASAIPYSTSEVDTGVDWVDGRRVYKRVFPITLGGQSDKDVLLIQNLIPTAAWIENSDFVKDNGNEQIHFFLGARVNGVLTTGYLMTKNGDFYIRMNNNYGAAENLSGYVTVCYTKPAT